MVLQFFCGDESCSGIEYKPDVTNISNLQLSESVKCKALDSSAVQFFALNIVQCFEAEVHQSEMK